jgi:hypothetical protein
MIVSSWCNLTKDVWRYLRGLYDRKVEVTENIPRINEHALSQEQRLHRLVINNAASRTVGSSLRLYC